MCFVLCSILKEKEAVRICTLTVLSVASTVALQVWRNGECFVLLTWRNGPGIDLWVTEARRWKMFSVPLWDLFILKANNLKKRWFY